MEGITYNFLRTNTRISKDSKLGTNPLYSSPHRLAIPIIQTLLNINNIAIFWTACEFLVGSAWGCDSPPSDQAESTTAVINNCIPRTASFFLFLAIPMFALFLQLGQGIQRFRRVLSALEVVIGGALALASWLTYFGLGFIGLSNNSYFELVFMASPGIGFNIIYLSFGAVAYHKERMTRHCRGLRVDGIPSVQGEDIDLEHGDKFQGAVDTSYNGYRRPSSVYSDRSTNRPLGQCGLPQEDRNDDADENQKNRISLKAMKSAHYHF